MSDLTTLLAEHHARYAHHSYHLVCACGAKWPALEEDYAAEIALHAAHVAEVIERTYAVVNLPEPDFMWGKGPQWVKYTDPEERFAGWTVWTAPGGNVMVQRIEPGDLASTEARVLAAALLAAANAAEGETHE